MCVQELALVVEQNRTRDWFGSVAPCRLLLTETIVVVQEMINSLDVDQESLTRLISNTQRHCYSEAPSDPSLVNVATSNSCLEGWDLQLQRLLLFKKQVEELHTTQLPNVVALFWCDLIDNDEGAAIVQILRVFKDAQTWSSIHLKKLTQVLDRHAPLDCYTQADESGAEVNWAKLAHVGPEEVISRKTATLNPQATAHSVLHSGEPHLQRSLGGWWCAHSVVGGVLTRWLVVCSLGDWWCAHSVIGGVLTR